MSGPDSVHVAVLTGHVAAGVAALGLGPLALVAYRRQEGWRGLGVAYQVALAALTTSALALVALAPARLWWLVPIAVATEAAAVCGWWVGRRAGSAAWAVRLLGGSYVSLVTALLVVSWGTLAAWVAPAVLGLVLVETAASPAGLRLVIPPSPAGSPATGTDAAQHTSGNRVGLPGRSG